MSSHQNSHVVEFYYDISCPFAYIASTKIEALAARTGATIAWRPVLLGAIYRATNAPQGAAGSASDVFNPTKKAVSSRAFQRTLKRHGIEYQEPSRHPQKTTAALRLLYFVSPSSRPQLTHALFRAYWVDGSKLSDRTTLLTAVRRSGIPSGNRIAKAIEDGSFEGTPQRQQLEASTSLAVERGSPGVPGFWLPDEVWVDKQGNRKEGRLYWGQDRMHFVEAVLHALNDGKNGDSLGKINMQLHSLMPRHIKQPGILNGGEVKLEFFYDFSSPWAFLGYTQLARLQRQFGPKLHIELKPFLLGILFREIGAPNLPMGALSQQKRDYMSRDHADWCRFWNAVNVQEGQPDKNIDFYWADIFPIRTPTVLRAAIAEPALTDPLFRACWERNLNMSSDDVVSKVIADAGFDAETILKKANSSAIKADLRARTAEAKEIGLCGVPTYRVSRRKEGEQQWRVAGDLVWGQDEINVVEDLIAGWDGEGVATVGEDAVRSRL